MKNLQITIILSIIFVNGCSLFYVAKQGLYQTCLISGAEPIEKALRTRDLDLNSRKKLELILDVRKFAVKKMHLTAHKNYKDVNLSWHETIHTVSASETLAFRPYQWWFPIIGSVPYKGFFDAVDAAKEEARLKTLGYETQNRPIHGYSTLGFFADPIWPNMLELSDFALTELIIHELAHATIYIPNQTSFNESLANFIGIAGTRTYVQDRYGNGSQQLAEFDSHQQQMTVYRHFFHDLYKNLNEVYSYDSPDQEKKITKNKLLSEAKIEYLRLPFDAGFKNLDWELVNNAFLLSFKRYNVDDTIFNDLLLAHKNGWESFINDVNFYSRTQDPFLGLKNRLLALKGHR